ncbi:MAG: toxin-antitoxin system YwqK family antitoxin [Cyclobacteriaceae bacterium]
MKQLFFAILLSFILPAELLAQEKDPIDTLFQDKEDILNSITDTPLTIDLEAEDEEEEEEEDDKKKKRKRKVFYGIKTKKGFTSSGFGNNITIETFYYLKEFEQPDPYVRDIYWFDFKTRRIKIGGNIDPDYAGILHGPYKKIQDDEVVEEGIFFKGTKHGRWMKYGRMYDYMVVVDKSKYFKGWPKESKVSYYDKDAKKLEEVIPIEYGKKEGNYYYFHENGMVAVQGEYRNDVKVGQWIEYYQFRRKRKKIIQYRNNPYDETFVPYIVQEWDQDGNLIYDREASMARMNR